MNIAIAEDCKTTAETAVTCASAMAKAVLREDMADVDLWQSILTRHIGHIASRLGFDLVPAMATPAETEDAA